MRKLRLLHECGTSMEEGDYDDRFPLHLAAAEGRVLAVSYLLGLSANPNCKDRWGGTPLDDALEGGTLYHMYCAKLIAGWGGRPGRREMGPEQKQMLEELEIEDVRALIKKLIMAGYDTAMSKRLTKQDLWVAMDASVRHVPVVKELFEHVDGIKALLGQNVNSCQDLVESLKDSVRGIASALDSKKGKGERTNRRRSFAFERKKSLANLSPLAGAAPAAPKPPSMIMQTLRFLDKLDAMMEGDDGDDEGGRREEMEAMWGESNGVDSDEEAALYAEVDLMAEAQERAMEAGVSGEKLAAKSFQKIAMKIVEVCPHPAARCPSTSPRLPECARQS